MKRQRAIKSVVKVDAQTADGMSGFLPRCPPDARNDFESGICIKKWRKGHSGFLPSRAAT